MPELNRAHAIASWMPADFVASTSRRSLAEFRSEFSEYLFLLVRIAEPSGLLAVALQRTSTLSEANASSTDNIDFTTVFCTSSELAISAEPGVRGGDRVAPEITRKPHFIVPVRARKWREADPRDRIWVGRTHSNDIVLRHPTVSKCHAWFSYDEERRLFVRDAKSRNETRVNGAPIQQESSLLTGGDRIAFGSIQAQVCSTDALWQILSR